MEIILLLIAALLIWAITIYNLLVRDRNRVSAAWSDIDVQLKRRHDLIPKLVDAVKQYAQYEQATLSAVTELRTRNVDAADVAQRGTVESSIGSSVQHLLAIAEAYPELKASGNFLTLQQDLTEVENDIQSARRYYNGSVRNLNTRIDKFPDLLIARAFSYRYRDYFQLDPAEVG